MLHKQAFVNKTCRHDSGCPYRKIFPDSRRLESVEQFPERSDHPINNMLPDYLEQRKKIWLSLLLLLICSLASQYGYQAALADRWPHSWPYNWRYTIAGAGPFVAYLLARRWLPGLPALFWGRNKWLHLAVFLVPVGALIFRGRFDNSSPAAEFALFSGLLHALYVLALEMGWRGVLYEAWKPLPRRIAWIGMALVYWAVYFFHLPVSHLLVSFMYVAGLVWAQCKLLEKGYGLLVTAALSLLLGNLAFSASPWTAKLLLLFTCIIQWILLFLLDFSWSRIKSLFRTRV